MTPAKYTSDFGSKTLSRYELLIELILFVHVFSYTNLEFIAKKSYTYYFMLYFCFAGQRKRETRYGNTICYRQKNLPLFTAIFEKLKVRTQTCEHWSGLCYIRFRQSKSEIKSTKT